LADKPVQFVAACHELYEALKQGPDKFVTRLPLSYDATCSGLQHLAAMTRAEKEGALVNLMPSENGQDFYQAVADEVAERFEHEGYDCPIRIDRGRVKRPIMSFLYGAGAGSFQKRRFWKFKLKGIVETLIVELKDDWKKLSKTIVVAIKEKAPRAVEARDFIRRLAELHAENNKMLRWFTLMPICNTYYKPDTKQMKNFSGKRTKVTVGDTNEVEEHDAILGAPANFTHSYDAMLLMMIANAADAEGLPLLTVHDCFAWLAPHAARGNEIKRQQLVKLYTENDPLAEIVEQARRDLPAGTELPPVPTKGSLDLTGIIGNEHTFRP
jgi:DNA-directed RNA polymerase, mitochondrial